MEKIDRKRETSCPKMLKMYVIDTRESTISVETETTQDLSHPESTKQMFFISLTKLRNIFNLFRCLRYKTQGRNAHKHLSKYT